MKSNVRLFDNSFWGGISAVFKMASSVIVVFVLIQLMGASSFGIVTIITTVTSIWMIINSGFYLILVRKLIHAREHDELLTSDLMLAGMIFTLMSALVLFFLFSVFQDLLLQKLFIDSRMPISYEDFDTAFQVAVIAIMIRIVIDYVSALFEGSGNFAIAAKLQMCSPAILLFTAALYLIIDRQMTVREYFLIMLISLLVELAVSCVILVKTISLSSNFRGNYLRSFKSMPSLLIESARLQVANIFSLFVDPLNKLILHSVVGPIGVTTYEVATRILNAMRGIFSAAFRSFMQISPELENAKYKYEKVVNYIFVPSLIMHFLVLVIMTNIISGKYIDIPIETIYLLILVLPLSMAIVVVAPLYSLLLGLGDLKYILLLHFRLALFNAAGSLILIPTLGVVGSGIALAIVTLYNAYSVYQRINSNHVKLSSFLYLVKSYMRISGVIISLALCSMYISTHTETPWSELALMGAVLLMLWILWREPLISQLMKGRLAKMIKL